LNETFEYFLDLYQSTTGRNIVALEQMLPIAEAYGATELVAYIEEAIESNRETRDMEGRWDRDRHIDEMARVEAHEISPELDKVVGAIHTQLESIAKAFPGRPRGDAAAELLEQLFPEGAGGYTNRPFEDKLSGVRFLLGQFDGGWRDEVEMLGIGPSVERLREVADEFEEALRADDGPDPLSWDEVLEARQEAQEAMLRVVAKTLGTFASASDDEARRELLAPIREQDERIGEFHRNQRGVRDVDPETGEEEEDVDPETEDDKTEVERETDDQEKSDAETEEEKPEEETKDGGVTD
jgi:hypothetical protein